MRYVGNAVPFGVGAILGWAATLYFLHAPSSSGDSASWVQAVGSIAAIFSSFWLLRISANSSRDTKRRTALQLMNFGYRLIDHGLGDDANVADVGASIEFVNLSDLQQVKQALLLAPIFEMDHAGLTTLIYKICSIIEEMTALRNRYVTTINQETLNAFGERYVAIQVRYSRLIAAANKAI